MGVGGLKSHPFLGHGSKREWGVGIWAQQVLAMLNGGGGGGQQALR